jgi:hypothetical protein
VGSVVTVSGTNLTGISSASIGATPVTTITPVSATQVKLTVPAGAHSGQISVTNVVATGTSSGTFKVLPKITGFTPTTAPRGTNIEIDGTTFDGATAVKFGTVAATFTVDDDSTIHADVPLTATTNKISVTTAAGTATSATSFTVLLTPLVSGFTPTTGVAATVVTINGSNFSGATGVTFNGVAATNVTPVSATQVKATVPPGATTGKVAVTTGIGTGTSGSNFTIPLAITGFSPDSGNVGDTIIVTGVGFLKMPPDGWAKFGDAQVWDVPIIDSDTQVELVVPPGAADGPISISTGPLLTRSADDFDVTISPFAIAARAIGVQGDSVVTAGENTKAVDYNVATQPAFGFSTGEITMFTSAWFYALWQQVADVRRYPAIGPFQHR